MKTAAPRKAGLARPEKLFLLSIILLMGSITWPVAIQALHHYRAGRAFSEMRLLLTAADFYHREYRLWPAPDETGRGDGRLGWGRGNDAVMRILRAEDGPGNEAHRANQRQIDFVAMARETGALVMPVMSESGEVLDPWGRPYQMVFDTNYDEVVEIPESGYPAVAGEGVVMWSLGPDGKPETADDLCSWKP